MKTVIAISGRSDWGKTSALRRLALTLPFEKILFDEDWGASCPTPAEKDRCDLLRIGRYKGHTIGCITFGDPDEDKTQRRWLERCIERECEIIIVACRTSGQTVGNVRQAAERLDAELIFTTIYHGMTGAYLSNDLDLNKIFAENVIHLIDNLIQ